MISHINSKWKKSYKSLPLPIRTIAKKQYKLFKINPYHSSLHFKRLHSNKPIYSARINKNYRTLGVIQENIIIWFWIGSHDDYDKLIK
jgi:mRNA-degrading endonuclease RelE of RelBE toxin-antitoxin system